MRWLNGIIYSMDIASEFEQTLGDSEGQGTWRAPVHGVAKNWTRL